jgi:hypothetical protein
VQKEALPDSFWALIELALQQSAPSRHEVLAKVSEACSETQKCTYLGSTLRFYLRKHGWPADM